MSAPLVIVTPDGFRVTASLLSNYYASAATVVFNFISGAASITSQLVTNANALAFIARVDNLIQQGATGLQQVSPNGVVITGCDPLVVSSAGIAAVVFYLNGNFTPDVVNGTLYLADVAGLYDDNDFLFDVAFVDSQTAIATWRSTATLITGDSFIYYKDSNGLYSNGFFGLTVT